MLRMAHPEHNIITTVWLRPTRTRNPDYKGYIGIVFVEDDHKERVAYIGAGYRIDDEADARISLHSGGGRGGVV